MLSGMAGKTHERERPMNNATGEAKKYAIPRFTISLVRDGKVRTPIAQMRSSRDVRDILSSYLADVDREHFVVLLLDQKNKVIGIHTVSTGSLTASIAHPREVLKVCILSNAASFVCGHNHPSGDPQPSTADRELTQRLRDAGMLMGIAMLDHVIIGDGAEAYYSFADNGLIDRGA